MSEDTILELIEDKLPYDGPHSRDTVIEAAAGINHLMRYLNNATQPVTAERTLEWVSTIYDVLGNIKGAAYKLDQLLEQLSMAATAAAEDPSVYDASSSTEERHAEGAQAARELADALTEMRPTVRVSPDGLRTVGGLARQLEDAHNLASRLGNDL